jgi:hypothetical protein
MSYRSRFPRYLALGFAVLLALGGCSNLPTQPVLSDSGQTATGAGSTSQVLGLLGTTSGVSSKTVGPLGGVVSAGDFTVVIPPLALTQTATITVSQPDLAHPVVNLSISPASANHFLVPVVLTGNVKKVSSTLLSVTCLSYYNPTTGKWEDLPSTVNVLSLTVSTPLSHFSTYRVSTDGKAGW